MLKQGRDRKVRCGSFTPRIHSVISPQNLGAKPGFSKGFCLGGEVTFQSSWGERVFKRNLNFLICALEGSLISDNLQPFWVFHR